MDLRLVNLFVWTACLVVAASFLSEVQSQPSPFHDDDRIDCTLIETSSLGMGDCEARGCLFNTHHLSHVPSCYLNRKVIGYTASAKVARSNGFDADLHLKPTATKTSPLIEQIPQLHLAVTDLTENILRVRITDPKNPKRFEVPLERFNFHIPTATPASTVYNVTHLSKSGNEFELVVTRKSTGTKLIDTSIGGLIYSDQLLQFATYLGGSDVYGLGESYRKTLKRDMKHALQPIFADDKIGVSEGTNLYGHHPYFSVVEKDGSAYGVLLLNTNAMVYTLMPAPAFSVKTTGGILDLFIFVADNPEHLTQLYTSIVGRPYLPAMWALGNQQSRWGYGNIGRLTEVIERTIKHEIPLDVMYIDSDYKDENREFVVKKEFHELNKFIADMRTKYQIRWTPIVDPCIAAVPSGYLPWTEGHKRDVFIKWPANVTDFKGIHQATSLPDNRLFYGKMWPKEPVAFVDFFKPAAEKFWTDMLKHLHEQFHYDGIWIDMNEPSTWHDHFADDCPVDKYNFARPRMAYPKELSRQTVCMSTVQGEHDQYRHYDVHSLHGLSEARSTRQALYEATGKRGFILSRNTFPSSGQYVAHWLGDTQASWDHLRYTLIGLLDMSLFGINFVGVDICGFFGVPTPEMCRRWLQLGAYYPFSRNHQNGGQPDHDPGLFAENGHPEVTAAGREAYRMRYQLIHYLYTRFYRSNVGGDTVMRPLLNEFPRDLAARDIFEQFLLGPSVLVNPFLNQSQTSVKAYVPEGSHWYRLSEDFVAKATPQENHVEFTDAESSRPLLLRAGSILPVIADKALPKIVNTATIRRVPIELWVLPDGVARQAKGDLFFDDGESIDTVAKGHYNYYEFHLDKCKLTIEAKQTGYQAPTGSADILKVSSINVAKLGAKAIPASPHVTISDVTVKVTTSVVHDSLRIHFGEPLDLLKLTKGKPETITFGTDADCFTY